MKPILIKELRNFFNSPSTYLVIGIFLSITGLFIWIFPDPAPNILNSGIANLSNFFELIPLLLLLLTPLLTMGVISEEKKSKTIELILTKPINEKNIITGKFLACLIYIIITFLPTIIYVFCINDLSKENLDIAQIITGYFGLILISSFFISIGIFYSALSKKQIIAFILTFITILFMIEGIEMVKKMEVLEFLSLFSVNERFEGFKKGIIDIKDIMFFISMTLLFIFLSIEILKKR